MESPSHTNVVGQPEQATEQHSPKSARTQQLSIMDNRLLSWHTEVRSKLIDLLTHYESVFTDGEVAVGKTDVLIMKIVLDDLSKPIRATMMKIKPSLQDSLHKQIATCY